MLSLACVFSPETSSSQHGASSDTLQCLTSGRLGSKLHKRGVYGMIGIIGITAGIMCVVQSR